MQFSKSTMSPKHQTLDTRSGEEDHHNVCRRKTTDDKIHVVLVYTVHRQSLITQIVRNHDIIRSSRFKGNWTYKFLELGQFHTSEFGNVWVFDFKGFDGIIICQSGSIEHVGLRHGPFDILGGGGWDILGKKFLALILTKKKINLLNGTVKK